MSRPGYLDPYEWDPLRDSLFQGHSQLGTGLYRQRRFVKGKISLADEIGHRLSGGTIELEEGRFFLYAAVTVATNDLTIVGQGNKTIVEVVTLADPVTQIPIRWTGDRGRLLNLRLEVNAALTPRMAQYLLQVEGDRFLADLVTTAGGANIIRVVAGATHARLHRLRIGTQTNVAILAEGDFHEIHSCEADASGAAIEVSSTGNQSNVLSNWCIGGNITVAGVGSLDLGNQV